MQAAALVSALLRSDAAPGELDPRQQQQLTKPVGPVEPTAKRQGKRKAQSKAKTSAKGKAKASAAPAKAKAKAKANGKAKAKGDPAPPPTAVPYIPHQFQEARVAFIQKHKESLRVSEPELTRGELQQRAQHAWMTSDERQQRLNSLPPKELKRRKF